VVYHFRFQLSKVRTDVNIDCFCNSIVPTVNINVYFKLKSGDKGGHQTFELAVKVFHKLNVLRHAYHGNDILTG
jgi:hypothetical protein